MVSKAREDLPEPETPVTTVKVLWGTSKSMFLRLWTRAPRTTMLSVDIGQRGFWQPLPSGRHPCCASATAESFYYTGHRDAIWGGGTPSSRVGMSLKTEPRRAGQPATPRTVARVKNSS